MAKCCHDRVVIYVPSSREWYRRVNLGLTPDRAEAHVYTREVAERLVGQDSQVELQPAQQAPSREALGMSRYDDIDSPDYNDTNVGMGMVPTREERIERGTAGAINKHVASLERERNEALACREHWKREAELSHALADEFAALFREWLDPPDNCDGLQDDDAWMHDFESRVHAALAKAPPSQDTSQPTTKG